MGALHSLSVLFVLASSIGARAQERDWAFVFLVTGSGGGKLSPQENSEAIAGHFSNMGRMARESQLCLAGPLGDPKADPSERGIYLFDASKVEQARAWTASDPAVKAGIFDLRVLPFRSRSDFTALLRLENLRVLEDPDGQTPMRMYVLATCEDHALGERVLAPLRDEGLVFFSGRFGGEFDGVGLFALDVTEVDEAREMLAFAGEAAGETLEWGLRPWYGSEDVMELPRLDARPLPTTPTFEVETLAQGERATYSETGAFDRRVDVFGLAVVATRGVSPERLLGEARSLARVLDRDEDGRVDVHAAWDALRLRGAFLAVAHPEEPASATAGASDAPLGMYLSALEIAFPAAFGRESSRRSEALVRARAAGRLPRPGVAAVGPDYLHTMLRILLGDEEAGRAFGWKSADYLRRGDPELVELFLDDRYGLPTALPDGTYRIGRLPPARFSFDADRVTTGRVYDYILSNLDGTHPRRISVHVASPTELEVLKWDPTDPTPTLVEARIDPSTLAAEAFHTWRLSKLGRETVAVLEVNQERTELVATVGARELRAPLGPGPWHSHDFDLVSLGFSMRHLETPACFFSFQRVDPVVRGGDVVLANVGEVHVRYLRDEKHNGYHCHVYDVDGPGLEQRGGTLWLSADDERFVVDQHLDLPAESGYDSSRLRLIEVTTLDRATWDAFLERRTR